MVVTNWQDLKIKKKQWQDKRVVLATGCFDILHPAHKQFLQAAKKEGEVLLVGVEPDKRVRQMKGEGRPVNPIKVRLENIDRLGIADFVFELPENMQSRKIQEEVIKSLGVKVLAVSSHTKHQKVKQAIMARYGGELKVVMQHDRRFSSTQIIKKLKERRV